MKKLRKVLSLLLIGAIMMTSLLCGSVTAGAEMYYRLKNVAVDESKVYVDGFYNKQGDYCIRVGNFGTKNYREYASYFYNQGVAAGDIHLHTNLKFGNGVDIMLADVCLESKEGQSFFTVPFIRYSEASEYESDQAEIKSARYFYNDDADNGMVIFIPKTSKLIDILKKTTSVKVWCDMTIQDKTYGIQTDFVTVKTNFKDLDTDKKTDDKKTDDKKTDDKKTDEKKTDDKKTDDKKTDDKKTDTGKQSSSTGYTAIKYNKKGTVKTTAQIASDKVRFSWDKVKGADKYAIYVYKDGRYKALSKNIKGTSIRVTHLVSGTTYQFIIRAHINGEWVKVYGRDVIEITAQ